MRGTELTWTHIFYLLHFIQEQRTHLFREKTVESYLFSHMIYMLRHGMYDINKQELNDRDNNKITDLNKNTKNLICML